MLDQNEFNQALRFEKAVRFASDNGYKGHYPYLNISYSGSFSAKEREELITETLYHYRSIIMFDDTFICAIFGEPKVTSDSYIDWTNFKSDMCNSPNPFEYLLEALDV
jgi:hypothetical protein